MIRLVVLSDSPPTVSCYLDQPVITIGSALSSSTSLYISETSVNHTHIKIYREEKRVFAINVAGDPFSTINGKPFGKRALCHNDSIQIGSTEIRFEYSPHQSESSANSVKEALTSNDKPNFQPLLNIVDTQQILPDLVEQSFNEQSSAKLSLTNKNEVKSRDALESAPSFISSEEALLFFSSFDRMNKDQYCENHLGSDEILSDEEMTSFDIDSLIQQVEELADLQVDVNRATERDANPLIEPRLIEPSLSASPLSAQSIDEFMGEEKVSDLPEAQLPENLAKELTKESDAKPASEKLAAPLTGDISEIGEEKKEGPFIPDETTAIDSGFKAPQKLSLKDYYLSEYDDVSELDMKGQTENDHYSLYKLLLKTNEWRLYFKIAFALFLATLIACSLMFLWMVDQSDKEEITATKGVADIAMALAYAQINNIHPQKENWSDPDFIKNNLMSVLPLNYSGFADFDTNGQFCNCPYLLRIYTSGNLSQFLVIAQPAPSLLQWLIPKSSIIVDSHAMEIRKTKDLRTLNRLLVNANTLDDANASEVSQLVRQGTLIPLWSIASRSENIGFSPPKALALIRPGAENLVYNAPRYYPLGEAVMKKSLSLIEKPTSGHEVTRLQQDLAALRKFPNSVLYSSGGIQNAIHAQKALTTLSPREKFLIAYLQLNTDGYVINSHLIVDDSIQEVAMTDSNQSVTEFQTPEVKSDHEDQGTDTQQNTSIHLAPSEKESMEGLRTNPTGDPVDEDDPLYLQFSLLNVFRQQALRPLNEQLTAILNKHSQTSQPQFEKTFMQLLSKYIDIDNEQLAKIQKKIDAIYHENSNVAASRFFSLARAAGLKELINNYVDQHKQQQTAEFNEEDLKLSLEKIENAHGWQQLEKEVAKLIEKLDLSHIPDEGDIITFQNATKSTVTKKLNAFILSPDSGLPAEAFNAKYRYLLTNVLKMSWMTDPETYDFYVDEFDQRSEPIEISDNLDDEF